MIQYCWLIPALPFLAAAINGLFGRKLGTKSAYVSILAMLCTFLLSVGIFIDVLGKSHHAPADAAKGAHAVSEWAGETVTLWNWIQVEKFSVPVAFHVDQLTSVMLLFISFVGSLVFIYASGYMKDKVHAHDHGHDHDDHHSHGTRKDHGKGHDHGHHSGHGDPNTDAHGWSGYRQEGDFQPDPGFHRFFAYLALFAGAMYTLVLADNFVLMFVGWEGVGLCSYLLIGYFFDRPFEKITCADAAKKAFVVNRIGDWGVVLAVFLLWWTCGSVRFQDINAAAEAGVFAYGDAIVTAATLLLLLGATGKSAQIPLFVWLPDAMAGPTPVSALIHAATMVTAGVYMVARTNVLFALAPQTMAIVAVVGALTALIAASIGLTQRGIKKVLAYSTVSQLGYMFMACGVGAFTMGIFHVFTHAFFKACLFLGAGSVIHAIHHEEDLFKMGGLKKYLPTTAKTYFIATLAIAGIPPLAGFFSKDEILWNAFEPKFVGFETIGKVCWGMGVLAALFTAIYMFRSYYLAFEGEERIDSSLKGQITESPKVMTGVLMVLAGASCVVGLVNIPAWTGIDAANFHHFLAPVTERGQRLLQSKTLLGSAFKSSHAVEAGLAIFSAGIGVAGWLIARALYKNGVSSKAVSIASASGPLYELSANRWWWDDIYNSAFVKGTVDLARTIWRFDQSIVDGLLHSIAGFCRGIGAELRRLQSGQVQVYVAVMALGLVLFLMYFAASATP